MAWWLASGVLAYRMGRMKDLGKHVLRLRKALADATCNQKAADYTQALALAEDFGWRPIEVGALAKQVGLAQEEAMASTPEPTARSPQHVRQAVAQLDDAVEQLIARVEDVDSAPQELQEHVQRLWHAASDVDAGALERRMRRLAQLLATPDAGRAAYVALCGGGMVEQGAGAEGVLPALLGRLTEVLEGSEAYLAACRRAAGSELNEEADSAAIIKHASEQVAAAEPELALAWWALQMFGRAAVALLSRSIDGRQAARSNEAIIGPIRRLAEAHTWAGWLNELLGVLDDEELLILHPAFGRGYRVGISGVADNFQLHTLLADALIGEVNDGWLPGRRPDPAVVAAARGPRGGDTTEAATGAFNMVGWRGLRADGSLAEGMGETAHWIWGEGVPSDIEPFEGTRVVLLGPPPYQRSWNVGRRFSGLTAEVQLIEHMAPEAVQVWLERIAHAPH